MFVFYFRVLLSIDESKVDQLQMAFALFRENILNVFLLFIFQTT